MIKHMQYIEAENLDEFLQIENDHFEDWNTFYDLGVNDKNQYWVPWLSYMIPIEEVDNPKLREFFKPNEDILDKYKLHYKSKVLDKHYGICDFIGVEATNEDFYWCFKNQSGRKFQSSCVGLVEWLDEWNWTKDFGKNKKIIAVNKDTHQKEIYTMQMFRDDGKSVFGLKDEKGFIHSVYDVVCWKPFS